MNAIELTIRNIKSKLSQAERLCSGDKDWTYSKLSQQLANLEYSNERIKEASDWIKFTLTYNKVPTRYNLHDVEKDYQKFIRRMSSQTYKNAYKRHEKKIKSIAVVEGGGSTEIRMHIHGIIELPSQESIKDMTVMISRNWFNTTKYTGLFEIEQMPLDQWVNYMLKQESKDCQTAKYSDHIFYS